MTPTEYVITKLSTKRALDRMAAALRTARRILDQGEAALASARRVLERERYVGRGVVYDVYEAARRPEERDSKAEVTCDSGEACTNQIVFYCGCARCDREPQHTEAFFCCASEAHLAMAYRRHVDLRGRQPAWFVGGPESRAAYLRP